MGRIRVGPARVPSQDSPEAAIELVRERGYDACEIDFESGFWMDYPWAERFGEIARENDVALSVHAPLFGWVGHLEASGRKWSSALGALDRSAGIATTCGAEVVVFHPGFLLGRSREDAIDSVVEQLALVRERLEGKGRAVPFGIEVMGRVRDLGSLEDCRRDQPPHRLGPPRCRLRAHARDERRCVPRGRAVPRRRSSLADVSSLRTRRSTSTSPTSPSRTVTRRSTSPTARGRCAPDPLREALAAFDRPATVVSESPDEESTQMIRAALTG